MKKNTNLTSIFGEISKNSLLNNKQPQYNLNTEHRYLRQTEDKTQNITRGVEAIIAEQDRRNNDVAGVVGRFFSWMFRKEKTKPVVITKKNEQNIFDEKLEEAISKKPVRLELPFQNKDLYFRIPDPSDYDPSITIAKKSVSELRQIEKELTAEIDKGPENQKHYLERGLARFYLHLNRREITQSEAEALNPNGLINHNFGSLPKITSDLGKAANLNTSDPIPLLYKGIIEMYYGRYENNTIQSQKDTKAALEINPNLLWGNHFFALSRANHHNNIAKKHYEAELEINPNPLSLLELANIKFKQKKFDQALEILKKTDELDPKTRLVNLRMAEIYRSKGNKELELQHLNKELENAKHHLDQKLINRVSRDLGYYYLEQNNPQEALKLFDYVSDNRMSHERYSILPLFDKANAIALIDGPKIAEKELLSATRERFVKSSLLSVHYSHYKLLNVFRIKHYGFDSARKNLEESLEQAQKVINPTKEQLALRSSLKTELATLLFVHSSSIPTIPERLELLKESKELISEDPINNSHKLIKKELSNLIEIKENNLNRKPSTKVQKTFHKNLQQPQQSQNIHQSNSF